MARKVKEVKQITNVFEMVENSYPKINLDEKVFWDKEIHNYRVTIYNEIALLYRRVWENRFDLKNSIKIIVKDNKMVVEFDKGFLKYLEELYPAALK